MAQRKPDEILTITYPTADVVNALLAFSKSPRPVVLRGGRGSGKSHIMAVLHHAFAHPENVGAWAEGWVQRGISTLEGFQARRGYLPISEVMDNNEYGGIWELLVERHPDGQRLQGKFEASGKPLPSRSLIEELLEAQPVALILDEFQKWYESLPDDPDEQGRKWQQEAFNLIKLLAEIADDRPDLLVLAVSFLDNDTEAYEQVNRVPTTIVDFSGPTAKEDRKRLLLHRLFQNRDQIPREDIRELTSAYATERLRLRFEDREVERQQRTEEVVRSWPFSPELLDLLEGEILMARAAQEARDLIKILAKIYRAKGEDIPLLTPADFSVDDQAGGALTLLDSIQASHFHQLRQKALNDLERLQELESVQHGRELISALWMRSMAPGRDNGATDQELQLDLTRETALDPNAFQVEVRRMEQNSVFVHRVTGVELRLVFLNEENPSTRVKATAGNEKFWEGQRGQDYAGEDVEHLRKTLRHLLVPGAGQPAARVIVLGPDWKTDPWTEVGDGDDPDQWTQPVLLVLPESPGATTQEVSAVLGPWLKTHVGRRRNTVRFLLPQSDKASIFTDDDVVFNARCSYLVSEAWKDDPKYSSLRPEFDKPLRDLLKNRYDRFAVLLRWDYQQPDQSAFEVERVNATGADVLGAVERTLIEDLFDPALFSQRVKAHAKANATYGKLLDELAEAPANGVEAIPYLGETALYERVLDVAADGQIALNVDGTWYGRLPEHASTEDARAHLRRHTYRTGVAARDILLGEPASVGNTTTSARTTPPSSGTGDTGPQPKTTLTSPVAGGGAITPPTPPAGSTALQGAGVQPSGPVVTKRTDAPKSGIDLTRQLELWEIKPHQKVDAVHIRLEGLTAQQVKTVLARLPSSVQASLELTYSQDEAS